LYGTRQKKNLKK